MSSSKIYVKISRSNDTSFRHQLFDEHLSNGKLLYNISLSNDVSFKQHLFHEGLSISNLRYNISHSNNISFKQQLFYERLASYNLFYNDSFPVCNRTNPLTNTQKRDFQRMSELLQKFEEQIVPYPTNHFYGRGIVLSVGSRQIKFAKVNLKMMEFTRTKLPLQV
jgi:hypothetical protein